MTLPESIGRNAPCPCGSGRKYKACCAQLEAAPEVAPHSSTGSSLRFVGYVAAGIALVVVLGLAARMGASDPAEQRGQPPADAPASVPDSGTLVPQPPGEAPPGKVWSPEHGHWHDAPGAMPANVTPVTDAGGAPTPVPAAGGLTPQPAGEAPPGKVWSPEHGHWHDAPGSAGPP
jgi:hypothetical protein